MGRHRRNDACRDAGRGLLSNREAQRHIRPQVWDDGFGGAGPRRRDIAGHVSHHQLVRRVRGWDSGPGAWSGSGQADQGRGRGHVPALKTGGGPGIRADGHRCRRVHRPGGGQWRRVALISRGPRRAFAVLVPAARDGGAGVCVLCPGEARSEADRRGDIVVLARSLAGSEARGGGRQPAVTSGEPAPNRWRTCASLRHSPA